MKGFGAGFGNRRQRQYYNYADGTCTINANTIHDNKHGVDRKENAREDVLQTCLNRSATRSLAPRPLLTLFNGLITVPKSQPSRHSVGGAKRS